MIILTKLNNVPFSLNPDFIETIEEMKSLNPTLSVYADKNGYIVGNGFDIAHGLPTQYGDFLNFIRKYYEYMAKDKKWCKTLTKKVENKLKLQAEELFTIEKYDIDIIIS